MDLDAGRERLTGRQKEGRPVDRVESGDALADDVDAFVGLPPPLLVQLAVAAVVECADVIDERIEPYVDDLGRAPGCPSRERVPPIGTR